MPPPQGSTLRVSRHANARFLLGSPVESVAVQADGSLLLQTPTAHLHYDFLVFATGFRSNWALRPEFSPFAPHIKLWSDRYSAPAGQEDHELSQLPDLGPLFEFLERVPGSCPGLDRVHCFSYPAALTYGGVSGDIPAISEGAKRMAQGLAGQLFNDDIELHFEAMQAYAEPELKGDEWQPGILRAEELRT